MVCCSEFCELLLAESPRDTPVQQGLLSPRPSACLRVDLNEGCFSVLFLFDCPKFRYFLMGKKQKMPKNSGKYGKPPLKNSLR